MAPNLNLIPMEMLEIIPQFDGNYNILNPFIKKAEYVIEKYKGLDNPAQDEYVFFAVTSRLTGLAAQFFGSREDIKTWEDLKAFLCQTFSDPRSEECIRTELDYLRTNPNESYYDFCNRIKHVKSTLMAKVNETDDAGMIKAKEEIYEKLSLNTFLYNLPENIVWVVRAKGCKTLEDALVVVTDEANFQVQYNTKRSRAMPPFFGPIKNHAIKPSSQFFGTAQGFGAGAAVKPGIAQGYSFAALSSAGPSSSQGISSLLAQIQGGRPDAYKSIFGTVAPTQHPGQPDPINAPAAYSNGLDF